MVPSGIKPEEVMAALEQYVDFSPGGFSSRRRDDRPVAEAASRARA